ncbi:WD repeat-containing protein 54 [Camelus dromedarius]|uniref:WD repeat-containing protein 54 n=1 Tax=Camelus dromedarius TaxID=9838 RepID=A0A5N4D8B0_CAMDR|nr:WD repeat-containing protein 54 [Camelus dromedarius]
MVGTLSWPGVFGEPSGGRSVVMPVPGVLTSQPGSPHLLSEELLDSRAHQSQTLPPSPPRPGYGFAYLSRADTGRADPGLSPHDCVADTVKTDDMHLHVSGRSGLIQIPAEFQESGTSTGICTSSLTRTPGPSVHLTCPDVGKSAPPPSLYNLLLSAAEDTFVHIWKLSRSPESGYIEVEHCHGACVPDTQVCGARFCDPSGSSFAVTGYDLAEILRFSSMRESSSPPSPLWYYL